MTFQLKDHQSILRGSKKLEMKETSHIWTSRWRYVCACVCGMLQVVEDGY